VNPFLRSVSFPLLLISPLTAYAEGVGDDFPSAEHPTREAPPGEWSSANHVATCVSDPKHYEEFVDHGPILRWPCDLVDGTLTFDVKPEGSQRLVITCNGDGHILRITLRDDDKSQTIGWVGTSSKENKGDKLMKKPLPNTTELNGQWVSVKLVMTGGQGALSSGPMPSS
jgi:hypothetical protein